MENDKINMIDHTQLREGVKIIIDGEPYEILESMPLKKAQRRVVIQTKIKNLINGNVFGRNFHQGEVFEEAELERVEIKFIYSNRGKFCFSETREAKNRFELTEEQIGTGAKFLKPNQILTGILFNGKFINIVLPIKLQFRVTKAPPGVKGERAQAGTKPVTLETGATINAPLFVEIDDIIEVNTETGEYVKRVE